MNGVCLGHVDTAPFHSDAVLLEVEQGDILFIPPLWWHSNELEEAETSITLSFGLFDDSLRDRLREPAPEIVPMARLAGDADAPQIRLTAAGLAREDSTGTVLGRSCLVASAYGLAYTPPEPAMKELSDWSRAGIAPGVRIFRLPVDDGQDLLFANGDVMTVPRTGASSVLLDLLLAEVLVDVRALRSAGDGCSLRVLAWLDRCGALRTE